MPYKNKISNSCSNRNAYKCACKPLPFVNIIPNPVISWNHHNQQKRWTRNHWQKNPPVPPANAQRNTRRNPKDHRRRRLLLYHPLPLPKRNTAASTNHRHLPPLPARRNRHRPKRSHLKRNRSIPKRAKFSWPKFKDFSNAGRKNDWQPKSMPSTMTTTIPLPPMSAVSADAVWIHSIRTIVRILLHQTTRVPRHQSRMIQVSRRAVQELPNPKNPRSIRRRHHHPNPQVVARAPRPRKRSIRPKTRRRPNRALAKSLLLQMSNIKNHTKKRLIPLRYIPTTARHPNLTRSVARN